MNIYIVICNGKISSEAYRTLKEAQSFCESRYGIFKETDWKYTDGKNIYIITDVQLRKEKK